MLTVGKIYLFLAFPLQESACLIAATCLSFFPLYNLNFKHFLQQHYALTVTRVQATCDLMTLQNRGCHVNATEMTHY